METRKVQVTGGSTYTVSLPKEWATENDVSSGTNVEFHSEQDLLLLTPQTEEEHTRGTLDVTDLTDENELTRAVMTMYVSGFDVISLETDQMTAGQRRTIRDATQGLVGLEVIEEMPDKMVLQDLLDSSELSIENAVTRMRLVSLTMLEDAVEALITDDDQLAQDVMERDDDVDRLWYMVSRVFRTVLRNPTAANEIGFTRETCFDYQSSARQLERIADHATKIAELALELGEIPDSAVEPLRKLHEEAATVPDTAMDALLAEDSEEAVELASEARQHIEIVDEMVRNVDEEIHEYDPQVAQILGLVIDSLSRTADYGTNIAESALQKSAPRP
ncbi:AbrB/MazE/SpoVT family DNA-binding domain-containing protein [Halovenus sp. WSH3]|uniref:AbrB/MazE/SpoVT family DNA-binding domain-containing protein n=1 Tax=Halovenus carboxidivorans TaxID=2692199 RepID=A0A6B0T576_9EURY|nr:phosphate uptake regulator PhoU [Halovenus carboxidivorans]MXR51336.1 AbrB/MazE/SpoVT family DNA-binding domain-containing protein [Halovenus carboxidivorans]